MKRYALIFSLTALVVLAGGNAKAAVDLDFGLKAGANFSVLKVDSEAVNLGNRIGFAGGGLMVLNFSPNWAAQVELLYSSKGASDEFEIVDEGGASLGTETGTFKLDYFEIPLLARFSPGGGPIFLTAGPSFAFKTSAKFTIEGQPDEELDWVKSSDLGITIGVGASAKSSLGKMEIDLRYTWGTTNINDGEGAAIKNAGLQTTLGFVF